MKNDFANHRRLAQGRRGQAMVEYILIIGLIALLTYAAVNKLGNNLNQGFENAANKVQSATDW